MLKKNKVLKISILSFFIICFILYVYLLSNVVSHANVYSPVKSDAIIVLGHSIDEDSARPDEWLVERLSAALELYEEGFADKIIVTGGKGPNDSIPVADAMLLWFLDRGVSEENILIENRSGNTAENFEFSREIAESNDISSVIIATNDFHICRSVIIAKDYFSEVYGCSADIDFDFNKFMAYLKEPLAIIKYKGSTVFSWTEE